MTTDLNLLETVGDLLEPPTGAPAHVHDRLVAGMRTADNRAHGRRTPRRTGVSWVTARLAWGGGLTVTAAAAVAGLLVLPGTTGPAPNGPPAAVASAPAPLTPARVFVLAADHAAAAPGLNARPDQFVYVEDVWVAPRHNQPKPEHAKHWLSVDGTHDGLSPSMDAGPACKNGRMLVEEGSTETAPCRPAPALDPHLPTDVEAMRAYLYRTTREQHRTASGEYETEVEVGSDDTAPSRLIKLLSTSYAPAVHAAAFRAAGTIPGLSVEDNATDVAGRPALAVVHTGDYARTEILFDPETYGYRGHKLIDVKSDELIRGRALLKVAIVDTVGDLP